MIRMKKNTLLMVALLLSVMGVNAQVEWTIWEGSMNASSSGTPGKWDSSLYLKSNNFANLSIGDVIYFTLTKNDNASGQAHVVLYYQNTLVKDETTSWPETELTYIDTDENYSYTITSDNLKYFQGYYEGECTSVNFINLAIKGYDFTLSKVSIKKHFSAIKTTLSDESVQLGNWANQYEVASSKLTNVKAGDYFYVPATKQTKADDESEVGWWQAQFYYDWANLYNVNSVDHDIWTEIQDADVSNITNNVFHLKGQYYNCTGVYLYHPINSFSIGSIGMATFSADQQVTAPANVIAYKATVNGSCVSLTPFTNNVIPANTGAIIKGDEGAVLEFTASSESTSETSGLTACISATDVTTLAESGYDLYVLYNNPTGGNVSLSLDDLNCGWGSSYNSTDKTITFKNAWQGRGWGWNFDYSDYSKVVVEFKSAPSAGVLKVQYNKPENYTEESGYSAGATSVEIALDAEKKNSVNQIYLSASAGGTLTLTNAYLVKNSGSAIPEFRKTTSGTLAANKAYLKIPQGNNNARSMSIVFGEDNFTGINTIEKKKTVTRNDDIIYNLNGQVVTNPSKGIYIKNGKKFVVK
jgi:hypothetical protein